MADGSADVSMWLGKKCETREVGRGFATRSGFAWSLTRDEVARAIECNLVVRVRTTNGDGQRVRKIASEKELVAGWPVQTTTAAQWTDRRLCELR